VCLKVAATCGVAEQQRPENGTFCSECTPMPRAYVTKTSIEQ
jgi:hypothetical protein